MIGTFVRSSHHLSRLVAERKKLNVIIGSTNYNSREAFLVNLTRDGSTYIACFQTYDNGISRNSINEYTNSPEERELIANAFNHYGYCRIIHGLQDLRRYGDGAIIALPDNFNDIYDEFYKNNRKLLSSVVGKMIESTNPLVKEIYCYCGNANYLNWALKNIIQFGISPVQMRRNIEWALNNSQLVSKLQKKNIISYNGNDIYNSLIDEIHHLREEKRASSIINTFNTEQKKLFKENYDKLPISLLGKFATLSFTKRQNFIRKMSTVTDLGEILKQMAYVSSQHFDWNIDSLKNYINNVENINCNVVYDKNNILIAEVHDYETVKRLAKTTNWCISKNKQYWNNYMGGDKKKYSKQYILFNMNEREDSEYSIVGFTTHKDETITHAHSFTNVSLVGEGRRLERFKTIFASNAQKYIQDLFLENEIPLSVVLKRKTIFDKWDKATFIKIICKLTGVNESDITVYRDDDNKFVFSLKPINNRLDIMLGGYNYTNIIQYCDEVYAHFFFVDFNVSNINTNKIRYALIFNHNAKSRPSSVYDENSNAVNASFNGLLEEFNLPYNIICRPDNIQARFLEALKYGTFADIDNAMKNPEIIKLLSMNGTNRLKTEFANVLQSSITSCSLDVWNLMIKYDLKWYNFFSVTYSAEILSSLYDYVGSFGRYSKKPCSDEDYLNLLNNNLGNMRNETKMYIAYSYIFTLILNQYNSMPQVRNILLTNLTNIITSHAYAYRITDELLTSILETVNLEDLTNTNRSILKLILTYRIKSCFDILLKKNIKNSYVRDFIFHNCQTTEDRNIFSKEWGISYNKYKSKIKSSISLEGIAQGIEYAVTRPN